MPHEANVAVNPEYADILIKCPVPEHADQLAQPLGEFMQTERGQRVLGESLENAAAMVEGGMDPNTAIRFALGSAAMKDEAGELLRATQEKQAPQAELAGSKKK
jgi:hypothetical protein